MRVFLAGATGVIGRPLVPMLVEAGHDVVGLTRSRERARSVEAAGAQPVVADALDRDAIVRAVTEARPDAVIHQLTSIPQQLNPRRLDSQFAATNALRREGTSHLIEGAKAAGAERFIAQSIAFAYPPGAGLADEGDPLWDDPPRAYGTSVETLREMERRTLEFGGTVLRYGHLHGPGTAYAPGGMFAAAVRRRQLPVAGDGGGVYSFVSTDDAARATLGALERDARGVFNVVDDDPVPVREWVPEYARAMGAPKPWRVPRLLVRLVGGDLAAYFMTGMRGASNARARAELGFAPRSWREGFAALRG